MKRKLLLPGKLFLLLAMVLWGTGLKSQCTQILPADIPGDNEGSFTKTISAQVFTFEPADNNFVSVQSDIGSFSGLYVLDYDNNDANGTEITISAPAGYSFDFNAFDYISDRDPIVNTLTITLTFIDGSTDVKSYALSGNSEVHTFSGFTTAANDVVSVKFVTNDLVYYNDLCIDDVKPVPVSDYGKIYWLSHETATIENMTLQGTAHTTMVSGTGQIVSLEVDAANGKVYWFDQATYQVRRANFDGSGAETFFTSAGYVYDMEVDAAASQLYFTSYETETIERINLDGTGQVSAVSGTGQIVSMVLDKANQKLYWFDQQAYEIRRADLDGTDVEDFLSTAGYVYGLDIDYRTSQLYFTSYETETIERISLDGTGQETAVSSTGQIVALIVDKVNDKVYWFDQSTSEIKRASLDGTGTEVFYTSPGYVYMLDIPVEPVQVETQVAALHCGTTIEYLNTQYIAADPVAGAEEYEFRITNGGYTATAPDNLQAGKVRMIQFTGYQYGTTYQMDVRVKVNGLWSAYGTACSITTTTAPHSEIQASQCGSTLAAIGDLIYTSTVNGATQYRFRVTNGASVQTIDRPVRNFQLSMLASYGYSTTYTIDVAVEFGGTWQPYAAACNVTTPAVTTSRVLPSQCGTTLAAVTSSIFAVPVSGATQYRFRVTNGASVQTIDRPTADFKLTQLASYAFSTTYAVDVAIEYNGSWVAYGTACNVATPAIPLTQVQASQCGASLATMTTYIYANSVSGATAYRFRFTEGANVQVIDNPTRAVTVTMLPAHKANTAYAVEAAAQLNGTWGAYGPVCNVTTPSVPTKIQSSQCGTTLPKLDKLIYADAINLATAYRFRVTDGASVQTIDRTTNSFYLIQLASYAYGTTYTIDAAVQYGGIWQPYGAACTVTTPVAGSVATTLAANSCGTAVSANTQALAAEKVTGATQYQFLVENASLSYSQSVTNNTFTFTLSQLTGLASSTVYTVKVRTKVNNTWSAYSTACNVTSSASGMRPGSETATIGNTASVAFEAVAFPNPFSGSFGVKVSTQSTEMVQVTVYDMSGKLLTVHSASPGEIHTLNIGENFSAGIYQMKVVQGTETQTLKVVKQ